MLPLHQARLKGFQSKAYQMMCQKSTRVPPTGLEPARPKGTGPQPAAYTIPPRGLAKLLWCLAQRTLQYSRLRAFCQLLYAGWRRCCRRLYTLATQPSFGLANEPGAFCFSCFERARTGTMSHAPMGRSNVPAASMQDVGIEGGKRGAEIQAQ